MTHAPVGRVVAIDSHPNADRLELLTIEWFWIGESQRPWWEQAHVVTGCHYRLGQRGVYLPPGAIIPGYLAEDLWLRGRASANAWVKIERKNMRGVESPGMFVGEYYKKDTRDPRSEERFEAQLEQDNVASTVEGDDWIRWRYWREHWRDGEDVSAYLGVRFG